MEDGHLAGIVKSPNAVNPARPLPKVLIETADADKRHITEASKEIQTVSFVEARDD